MSNQFRRVAVERMRGGRGGKGLTGNEPEPRVHDDDGHDPRCGFLLAELLRLLVPLVLLLEREDDARGGVHDGHAVEQPDEDGEWESRGAGGDRQALENGAGRREGRGTDTAVMNSTPAPTVWVARLEIAPSLRGQVGVKTKEVWISQFEGSRDWRGQKRERTTGGRVVGAADSRSSPDSEGLTAISQRSTFRGDSRGGRFGRRRNCGGNPEKELAMPGVTARREDGREH